MRSRSGLAVLAKGAAIAAMSAFVVNSADALTLPDVSAMHAAFEPTRTVFQEGVDAAHVDKVWWCRWGCGWGWRPYGWGAPAVAAGVVAGAAVAAAATAPPPGCWRRVWGYYGWRWARVC